jgi:hypothetical protein
MFCTRHVFQTLPNSHVLSVVSTRDLESGNRCFICRFFASAYVGFVSERANALQLLTTPAVSSASCSSPWVGLLSLLAFTPMIRDLALQFGQMLIVAHAGAAVDGVRAQGESTPATTPWRSVLQPYRDLWKLLRKERGARGQTRRGCSGLAVPDLRRDVDGGVARPDVSPPGSMFSISADLIAIVRAARQRALRSRIGRTRRRNQFGGIGSSREVMIASLAEPALIMVRSRSALIAGSTQIVGDRGVHDVGRRRPARLARARAVAPDHRGDRRERAHAGRQSGDPSRAHDGARRQWCSNIRAGTSRSSSSPDR